jgi:hypothetical protein
MNPKDQNSQPRNDGSTNADNSVVRAAGEAPLLDAVAVEGHSPPSPEGRQPSAGRLPSDASVCQPAGGVRAVEGEKEWYPTLTGSELEAADMALLRAENARLRRLAEACCRESRRRGYRIA